MRDICNTLQNFTESNKRAIIFNMPPRHGKSFTATHLVEWLLGINPDLKVMTASYNETLSTRFSKKVRDDIQEVKADEDRTVYSDIFPNTQIRDGDAAVNLWSLKGSYNNYLSTSPTGTATGFGANYIIVDDIIKNSAEAYNKTVKDKHWEWLCNTMLSRLEAGGKIIIIMTRWADDDLAGRLIKEMPKEDIEVINYKAVQPDGSMLCEDILSKKACEEKKRLMGLHVWSANYQQEPIDLKDRLYSGFKTYEDIPRDRNGNPLFTAIKSYTDTADEGSDYLCHIVYGEYQKEAYVLDVIYTQKPMEYTEGMVAESLFNFNVRVADIESNNGGKGFARAVQDRLRTQYKSNMCRVQWFHQSANKISRILTNAPWVMSHVYFPVNWRDKWPEFYDSLMTYQREGKNAHDDSCFVAGTMISTIHGDIPIEKIRPGERVITPVGIRTVAASGKTGDRQTITKMGLRATPTHKVFNAGSGFIYLRDADEEKADKLTCKRLMVWMYRKQLYSMGNAIVSWGREDITSASRVPMKDENMRKDFMWRFGNFITNSQYQKAIAFTTGTAIHLITALKIWNAYRLGNIFHTMRNRDQKSNSSDSRKQDRTPQELGIQAPKEEHGTQSMAKKLLKNCNWQLTHVWNVVRNFKASGRLQSSVAIGAENVGVESMQESHIQQLARNAEEFLRQQKKNHLVRKINSVAGDAQVPTTINTVPVYNITVEGAGCYFANGVLVSNCDCLTGVGEKIMERGRGININPNLLRR